MRDSPANPLKQTPCDEPDPAYNSEFKRFSLPSSISAILPWMLEAKLRGWLRDTFNWSVSTMVIASALGSSTAIVGYLALFAAIGFGFIFVNLLVGHFLRPADPHEEKQEIYECGEPAIGSSFVQFDLRFYVVALVFIIFDVEVAFLFPWATVFGKATNLWHDKSAVVSPADPSALAPNVEAVYRELGVREPGLPLAADGTIMDPVQAEAAVRANAHDLATLALVAGAIFFSVLFVGFAYEWRTGALDWVKSIRTQNAIRRTATLPSQAENQSKPQSSVLSV